jgi:hypothetical protein
MYASTPSNALSGRDQALRHRRSPDPLTRPAVRYFGHRFEQDDDGFWPIRRDPAFRGGAVVP